MDIATRRRVLRIEGLEFEMIGKSSDRENLLVLMDRLSSLLKADATVLFPQSEHAKKPCGCGE